MYFTVDSGPRSEVKCRHQDATSLCNISFNSALGCIMQYFCTALHNRFESEREHAHLPIFSSLSDSFGSISTIALARKKRLSPVLY